MSQPRGKRPWLRAAAGLFVVGWGANQFTALLIAYHHRRGLSTRTDQALFGVYALGLIPALLVSGPLADRVGRGRLLRPAVVCSFLATLVLVAGARLTPLLYLGRLLAGLASGAAFAAGTAWVKELSAPPYDPSADEQGGARRAAIALSAGFGLGPVTTGLLGQWLPGPLVTAYLPHLVLCAVVLPALRGLPEASRPTRIAERAPRLLAGGRARRRFTLVVVPLAPWVFAGASVAFAVLPAATSGRTGGGTAFAGALAVQPLTRRLDRPGDRRGALAGLGAVIAGLVIAAEAARTADLGLVLLAAILLGAGYGGCLVAGLLEVQRIASPGRLAALTALFYVLTYVGFGVPFLLAELTGLASYPWLLLGLTGLASGCALIAGAAAGDRRQQVLR